MLFKWIGCSLVWMGCNLIVDKMLLTSMGCSLGYKIDTLTTLEYDYLHSTVWCLHKCIFSMY